MARDAAVTLVVGPAGSGKTQLVASWVRGLPIASAVAWVTLEDDDQTDTFWAYVVEALRRAGALRAPPVVPSGAAVDRAFLVKLAAEISAFDGPVLLVLDGVSTLCGDSWAAELDFLHRQADGLRLVLVGRWDPPLSLHRYRLAGSLMEIRSHDLAFTAEEAAELLRLHGVVVSPVGLASLLAHTEGWAAGLRLFAMALQDHRDADRLVDTITGNEATIGEYFIDEVLRIQPPHVRAFLLDISILDTFTPELAEAVTGRPDARRLLVDLERHNAFVQPAADFSTAYRFHRLFAELLRAQAQLMCEAPERTEELHRRAAVWFAGTGTDRRGGQPCAQGAGVRRGRDDRDRALHGRMPGDRRSRRAAGRPPPAGARGPRPRRVGDGDRRVGAGRRRRRTLRAPPEPGAGARDARRLAVQSGTRRHRPDPQHAAGRRGR